MGAGGERALGAGWPGSYRSRTPGCVRALARRDAELEQMAAELAVLKRMVFGRSSERMRAGDDGGADPTDGDGAGGGGSPRGGGAGRGGETTRICPGLR